MSATVTAHRVTSRDGTDIGYLAQGHGPGVVLVQGAMADVHAYSGLARDLSRSFTVIRAERRGRGISSRPYDDQHALARDVEDVEAVMAVTGARALFGLSSGAVIALEAARTLDAVEQLVVFEPPFYVEGIDRDGVRRLGQDIEAGRWGAALVGALVTAGTAPPVLARLPRPLAGALGRVVLAVQARRPGPGASLRELLPGVRFDFHDVAEVDGRIASFADIRCPVLLLSGSASPAFLRAAIGELNAVLPEARHVELDGLGHDGPWNSGGPEAVASVLRDFFKRT